MQNAECMQAILELFRKHGCAVVGEEGARQSTPHQCLAEAVHEAPHIVVEVPLDMRCEPRAVVNDAQSQWLGPAAGGEHVARAKMVIKMPKYAVHCILWRMRSPELCGVGEEQAK